MVIIGTATSRKWTIGEVDANCKSLKTSYDGAVGDRFYSFGRRLWMEPLSCKAGKVFQTSSWSLSADGRTMTVRTLIRTPDGNVTICPF